eukprot:TRINITY_DN45718_c0_g2_i1.p1 TRINITY_DN45718_c0_g2~~TRINITY_DN45718_c0_g2_i1.p1  ORF type:complete len:120 (+),score=17.41 TRINITY_DN45718_c0_g2_i1:45-362(+)
MGLDDDRILSLMLEYGHEEQNFILHILVNTPRPRSQIPRLIDQIGLLCKNHKDSFVGFFASCSGIPLQRRNWRYFRSIIMSQNEKLHDVDRSIADLLRASSSSSG